MLDRVISQRLISLLSVILLSVFGLVASADVVVVKNSAHLLPISFGSESGRRGVAVIGSEKDNCSFADYCTRYFSMPVAAAESVRDKKEIERLSDECSTLICGVFSSERWAVELLSRLADGRRLIVCFFMPDSEIASFAKVKGLETIVAAGTDDEMDQIEAAEIIFGGMAAENRLEAAIPGIAQKGAGVSYPKTRLGYTGAVSDLDEMAMASKIDSIAKASIKAKAFPGCQIVVIKDGQVVYDEAFGTLDYSAGSRKVDRHTLFDIASMTKATATLSGLMCAYDDGLYQIDRKASAYLPRLRNSDKESLTVRDFLYHTTGIPPVVNTYSLMADRDSYSGKLLQYSRKDPYTIKIEKGVYGHKDATLRKDLFSDRRSTDFNIQIAPGVYGGDSMKRVMSDAIYRSRVGEKKYVYSCLNFCILKDMEEALTGKPHDQWVAERVFEPIGANLTMYRPSDHAADMQNIAPTEQDDFMRKSLLKGFVHDEMASYLGGVSGNAGLFSTAGDIAKLCQTWLNGGSYGGRRIFKNSTVERFTTESSKSSRGLGFDKPSRLKSTQAAGMSKSAYGHTGFTGTCFWIDPEYQIAVVILTNRVNPSRDNAAFSRLDPRNAILKAVMGSLYNEDAVESEDVRVSESR